MPARARDDGFLSNSSALRSEASLFKVTNAFKWVLVSIKENVSSINSLFDISLFLSI